MISRLDRFCHLVGQNQNNGRGDSQGFMRLGMQIDFYCKQSSDSNDISNRLMVAFVVAMPVSVTMGFPWVSTLEYPVSYCKQM